MTDDSDLDVESLLWILYSDANSRFNTLIEECAHLQDTILSLVDDPTIVKKIIDEQGTSPSFPNRDPSKLDATGFSRKVVSNPRATAAYDRCSVRDRAFLSLWNTLGALIVGLFRNQDLHHQEYKTATADAERSSRQRQPATEQLFWYTSVRGYFINRVFRMYTTQLEHAHEKLIQMLENQAGTLPNPILLRRWNSGAYGEFLSEYSRHVNWETNTLIRLLTHQSFEESPDIAPFPMTGDNKIEADAEDALPAIHSFTHSWTHYPTSLVKEFDVWLNVNRDRAHWEGDQKTSKAWRPRRFASIRSSYFYLEQSVLFPLLYHECAHVNFSFSNKSTQAKREEAYGVKNGADFFAERLSAVNSLRLAKFPSDPGWTYENFWNHFTEEIWADAIAIIASGRAYFTSLILQVWGLSGDNEFNHFAFAEDATYPINKFGRHEHRKYEVPSPRLELPYFWEARLSIALKVLETVHRDATSQAVAVRSLMDAWWKSGGAAFDERGTSERHSRFWAFRKDINEWVAETVWKYLQTPVTNHTQLAPLCTNYDLHSVSVRSTICEAVNNYREKYFGPNPKQLKSLTLRKNTRLDEVASDIRWHLAPHVVMKMRNSHNPAVASKWSDSFANWMRNDGTAAVRVALEAQRLRYSLLDTAADIADSVDPETPTTIWKLPSAGLPSIIDTLIAPAEEYFTKHDVQSIQRQRFLRSRRILDARPHAERSMPSPDLLNKINSLVDEIMKDVGWATSEKPMANKREIQVGTLSFGVIRPDDFSRPVADGKSGSAYWDAVERTKAVFAKAAELKSDVANCDKDDSIPYLANEVKFDSIFVPLVGEYQFLTFSPGSTPVERDAHPESDFCRTLLKPRLVMLAGGEPLQAYEPSCKTLWGRISLIRFQYKWQWYDIKTRLDAERQKKEPASRVKHYSLYLSSAWEDAILLTWHDHASDLWELDKLGVGVTGAEGIDIQSAYSVPTQYYENRLSVATTAQMKAEAEEIKNAESNTSLEWADQLCAWADTVDLVSIINHRSGRFDYTVVWTETKNTQVASPTVSVAEQRLSGDEIYAACARGLASIPASLWQNVSSMSTSFEKNVFYSTGTIGCKYIAVTHFALKEKAIRLDGSSR